MWQSCESKVILLYAGLIFPIRQRKGNVKASKERMTAPFALDSKGMFVDVHSHGGYVGWLWGFANRRTPNNAGLGTLGRKFASFSGYGLWAPKMPN
jgi:carboxypeptidase T